MSSTKRKAPPVRIARPHNTHSAKPMIKPRVDEAKTSVEAVPKHFVGKSTDSSAAIEISSDEGSDDGEIDKSGGDDEDDDLMDEDDAAAADGDGDEGPTTNGHAAVNGNAAVATSAKNAAEDEDEAEAGDLEPTFGDLIREHKTVDVAAALGLLPSNKTAVTNGTAGDGGAAHVGLVEADAAAVAPAAGTDAAPPPTLASLSHLLNAALRSGDDANLEVCLGTTTEAAWVRNTVARLDPALAGVLLQKLAARIHRRPGRAHTLVGWVQWTLITHGGALLAGAQQAGVARALQELHRVLEERARGLNSLLLLKGKLDMLEAQMQMRRMQRETGGVASALGGGAGVAGTAAAGRSVGRNAGAAAGRRRSKAAGRARADDDGHAVATYYEGVGEDVDDEAGQILVNGASAVASQSFVEAGDDVVGEDDDDDNDDADDDDADEEDVIDAVNDDDDDLELEEMDGDDVDDINEVDFDDVDEDEDDDDEEDDEEEAQSAAARPPPAKMQKKSGSAFSKRR